MSPRPGHCLFVVAVFAAMARAVFELTLSGQGWSGWPPHHPVASGAGYDLLPLLVVAEFRPRECG